MKHHDESDGDDGDVVVYSHVMILKEDETSSQGGVDIWVIPCSLL